MNTRSPPPAKAYEATKSFYQYVLLLGGVSFGVAELSFLKTGDITDVRVVLGSVISVGFLLYLLTKKKLLEDSQAVMIPQALGRRYLHVCADYLCVIGVTALFSMLAFMVLNDVSLFRDETAWGLTAFSFTVILNMALFGLGMVFLYLISAKELS